MIDRLKAIFRVPAAIDRERAYLEEAASLVDLEMRQREIDRGRFRRRPYGF